MRPRGFSARTAAVTTAPARAGVVLTVLALIGTLMLSTPAPAGHAAPAADDPVTDLGEAVQKVQTLASGLGTTPDGSPIGFYLASGNPNLNGEFAVVDLRSQETVFRTRVPHGVSSQRAMDQSPVDQAIYFGTSDVGHLYRHRPGSDEVEHLAALPDGERFWSLTVAEDGLVWFGSYPGGTLYSYDPATDEITDHGQAIAGEQYIDSIAPYGDTVIVGTQPNGRMATYHLDSGEFTPIEMPDGHSATAITELDIRHDQASGRDLLFVSTDSIYVRDLSSGTWIDEITGANARVSPVDPVNSDLVYLRQDAEIKSYSLTTGTLTGTGKRPNATPESWAWLDMDGTGEHPILALTYWNQGRSYGFDLYGGSSFYLVPDLEGAGAPLISLGTGPEGDIYAGAFLSPPGSGRYDPDGSGIELLNGTSQVEGWGTFDGKVVFGRYPQGSVYLYDPSEPWDYGSNPAAPLELGDGQSRPHSFIELTAVPETVAVGSVPVPGEHGGAITLWQPYAGTHTVYRHVVPDQTPVSLVQHEGILLGGTSIQGGYGIDPVTDEASLFAWDPVSGETLWTLTPIPGVQSVSGLALDADGHLWGVADNRTVFEFDLDAQEVLRTIVIDAGAAIDRFGDDHRLLFDHGRLFGSVANRLFVLDQLTGEVTSLYGAESGRDDAANTVTELAQDRYGDLYVVGRGTHLVRYDLPADVTAPTVEVRASQGSARRIPVWLEATDNADPSPQVDYRIDGGEWQRYRPGRPVIVTRGADLEYRAIDSAWNSSEVSHFTV